MVFMAFLVVVLIVVMMNCGFYGIFCCGTCGCDDELGL